MKTRFLKSIFLLCMLNSVFGLLANGQIVYTDIIPDKTCDTDGCAYNLDLNNDGIIDFTIDQIVSLTSSLDCSGTKTIYEVEVIPVSGNATLINKRNFPYPTELNYGDLINSDSIFQDGSGNQFLAKDKWNCSYFGGGWQERKFGAWISGTIDKYLGLRMSIANDTLYGWARLDVGVNGTSFTIKDYAYNSIPNQSLLAGQYDCAGPIVSIASDDPLKYCSGDSISTILTATSSNSNQLQWLKNGSMIAGATDSFYIATSAGTYQVQATSDCGRTISSGLTISVISFSNLVLAQGATLSAARSKASYQWIDCSTGQPISGATNQTFTAYQNGAYTVVITFKGCTDTSACYSVIATGISSPGNLNFFSLIPNPLAHSTTIAFSLSQTENISLKIFDLKGRLIKIISDETLGQGSHQLQWNATDENGNAVSAGIYLIKIASQDFSQTEKLMVVK